MGRPHLAVTEIGTYDHIDFRVRNLRKISRFYDALMPALGLRVIRRGDRIRDYWHEDRRLPFFSLVQAATSTPTRSRIAFAAPTRKDVDRVAKVARRAGAKEICGPEECYRQPYYAVFFEDPDGNKLEVCCRR
jgi:catechol 2,3-dioxygenase-like lactoylglutathione lyase family enzyme